MTSRRRFLATVSGGLVARPLVARAQPPAMPVVGFLSSLRASERARILPSFHQGLSEAGYVEGRNVAIEYRWAEGQYDRSLSECGGP
jgi:putative ABC transport system substrate-binding protein